MRKVKYKEITTPRKITSLFFLFYTNTAHQLQDNCFKIISWVYINLFKCNLTCIDFNHQCPQQTVTNKCNQDHTDYRQHFCMLKSLKKAPKYSLLLFKFSSFTFFILYYYNTIVRCTATYIYSTPF